MIMLAKQPPSVPRGIPDPPTLYMALVPILLGTVLRTYAPVTLAPTRSQCWDRVLAWADRTYRDNKKFIVWFSKCSNPQDARVTRHMAMWTRYKPDAPRATRIAWLRRYGCRVDVGTFISIKLGAML